MPIKVTIRGPQIKQLEADLGAFVHKALPIATRSTLNVAAFETQDVARKRIRNQFVLRNRRTIQTVLVNRAFGAKVSRMQSSIGSTEQYMVDQEFGAVIPKKGKHGVPIPTSFSAGQGESARPRIRLPRVPLRRVQLSGRSSKRPPGQPKNKKQAFLFKVQDAVSAGGKRRTFFHDSRSGKKTGIYRVRGGSKRFKRGWPKGAEVKLLFALDKKAVVLGRKPWLKPSVDVVEKRMPRIHIESLTFQLKRHGLFRG